MATAERILGQQSGYEQLLAESLRWLEHLARCDAHIEQCVAAGQTETLAELLRRRQQAITQLQRLGGELQQLSRPRTPGLQAVTLLHRQILRLAELAASKNRTLVAQLQEQLSALANEISKVQTDAELVKRYLGTGQDSTEFDG